MDNNLGWVDNKETVLLLLLCIQSNAVIWLHRRDARKAVYLQHGVFDSSMGWVICKVFLICEVESCIVGWVNLLLHHFFKSTSAWILWVMILAWHIRLMSFLFWSYPASSVLSLIFFPLNHEIFFYCFSCLDARMMLRQ